MIDPNTLELREPQSREEKLEEISRLETALVLMRLGAHAKENEGLDMNRYADKLEREIKVMVDEL